MNELRITDCYISFKSDATTYDKVVDDFLRHCVAAGIDISINNMAVYNEKGNEIDEQKGCRYEGQATYGQWN